MTSKKLVYTIMLASLAVNLFLAGAFFTHILRPAPDRPVGPPERFDMRAARQALAPEYREIIDRAMHELRNEGQEGFEDMFGLREELREILMADEFDRQAFDTVFGKILAKESELRGTLQTLLADIADSLPADQRRRFFRAGFTGEGPDHPRDGPPRRR